MWAAAASWFLGNPWRIALVAVGVIVAGLWAQNQYYGWRIDQVKSQRDALAATVVQYKDAADRALSSARAQNAALAALLAKQAERMKQSEQTRARLEQSRVQLEAELALLLDRPKPQGAEELCAASCALLRSPL